MFPNEMTRIRFNVLVCMRHRKHYRPQRHTKREFKRYMRENFTRIGWRRA